MGSNGISGNANGELHTEDEALSVLLDGDIDKVMSGLDRIVEAAPSYEKLFARWQRTYGDAAARAIAIAHGAEPPLDLTVKSDAESWAQRLRGISIGFVTLTAINVIRLAALTVIASRFPDWFAYFHEYFFQGLFIALLAVLASLWTEQVRRATVRQLPA